MGKEPIWILFGEQSISGIQIDWIGVGKKIYVGEGHEGGDVCIIHDVYAAHTVNFVRVEESTCGVYNTVLKDRRADCGAHKFGLGGYGGQSICGIEDEGETVEVDG